MIALDTLAVICLIEAIEPAQATMLRLTREHGDQFVVSTLDITECLTTTARTRHLSRKPYADCFDAVNVRVEPVTTDIARFAAELRSARGLKTVDSVHLATAIQTSASLFVSTDRGDFARCAARISLPVLLIARRPDGETSS